MYQLHPCKELVELFRAKPYQGAKPEDAEFVFVGLDANFKADIGSQPENFALLKEYLRDGPTFWRERENHHPFLLIPGYGGRDGEHYHRNFKEIGFGPQDADRVSFVELLHLPTVGVNKLEAKDLDTAHLVWLDSLMNGGGARPHVFLCDKAIRLLIEFRKRMLKGGHLGRLPFEWLPEPIPNEALPKLRESKKSTIYQYLHFSNWGKFQERMTLEAHAIAALRELNTTAVAPVDPQGVSVEVP